MKFTNGYKNRYEVYAHLRKERNIATRKTATYSIYIYDTCIVFAREQFRAKYPEYVIDTIRLAKY